jgi:hypothetical protein
MQDGGQILQTGWCLGSRVVDDLEHAGALIVIFLIKMIVHGSTLYMCTGQDYEPKLDG